MVQLPRLGLQSALGALRHRALCLPVLSLLAFGVGLPVRGVVC